ncbi:TetR/AcrR family transcriptional regulator [Salibacterium halotolerans]|nr:TetR/AcrR family transcriptional regulator [Salibacterium halotolerans]
MDKHETIIKTALQMFSEKGYFYTSVQEIVTSCGMSKGSFYNYFASKEDLLIESFRYNHQQILKKAEHLHMDESLSLKNQLIKMISMELEGMADNREFFLLLQKVVSVQEHKKLMPLMKRTRAAMINLHKEWLLKVYGESIRPQIWDHVLFLQGAMKEYITILKEHNFSADPEMFAGRIISKLDVLVKHGSHLDPILTDDWMSDYEQMAKQPDRKTTEEKREEQLTAIREQIAALSESSAVKQELTDAVHLLEEEWKKTEPRSFLINALFGFLTRPELKETVETLKEWYHSEQN